MEHSHLPDAIELTGIHINLEEHAIEFEDRHGTIGRLVFTRDLVRYEGAPLLLYPAADEEATPIDRGQDDPPTTASAR